MVPKLLRIPFFVLVLLLTGGLALAADGWLGVQLQDLNPDMAKALQLQNEKGVLVGEVVKDSPAAAAGIEAGDVIVSFADKPVVEVKDLTKAVRKASPGDEVTVTVVRNGDRRDLEVTLGERKEPQAIVVAPSGGYLGVGMQNLTQQLGQVFGVTDGRGVLVSEVHEDTPAAKAGLQAGDVIVKVDDESVADSGDLQTAMLDHKPGDEVRLEVVRKGDTRTLTATLGERPEGSSITAFMPDRLPRALREFMPRGNALREYHDSLRRGNDGRKDEMQELREELQELREELDSMRQDLKQH